MLHVSISSISYLKRKIPVAFLRTGQNGYVHARSQGVLRRRFVLERRCNIVLRRTRVQSCMFDGKVFSCTIYNVSITFDQPIEKTNPLMLTFQKKHFMIKYNRWVCFYRKYGHPGALSSELLLLCAEST